MEESSGFVWASEMPCQPLGEFWTHRWGSCSRGTYLSMSCRGRLQGSPEHLPMMARAAPPCLLLLTVPFYTLLYTYVYYRWWVIEIHSLLFPAPPKFIQKVTTQISSTTAQCTPREKHAWTNAARSVSCKAVGSVCELHYVANHQCE